MLYDMDTRVVVIWAGMTMLHDMDTLSVVIWAVAGCGVALSELTKGYTSPLDSRVRGNDNWWSYSSSWMSKPGSLGAVSRRALRTM